MVEFVKIIKKNNIIEIRNYFDKFFLFFLSVFLFLLSVWFLSFNFKNGNMILSLSLFFNLLLLFYSFYLFFKFFIFPKNEGLIFDNTGKIFIFRNIKIPFNEIDYFTYDNKTIFYDRHFLVLVKKDGSKMDLVFPYDLISYRGNMEFVLIKILKEIKELGFKVKYLNNS
jgi:hypothetical protein